MSAPRERCLDVGSANEVLRWPVFDPVTVVASDVGLSVRREGFGARLLGASSISTVPWAECHAEREADRPELVRVALGEHTVVLHGRGGEMALGFVHAAGPAGGCRCMSQADDRRLPGAADWVAVGAGGVAHLPGGLLARSRVRLLGIGDVLAARVGVGGGLQVATRGGDRWDVPSSPGAFEALAAAVAARESAWHPGDLPDAPFEVVLERPVAWVQDRLRLCTGWLRVGVDGLEVFGEDGSSISEPASALRRIDGDGADRATVHLRAGGIEHELLGSPGEELAAAVWGLLQGRMFAGGDGAELGPEWRRCSGRFERIRLESVNGHGQEWTPTAVHVGGPGLTVLLDSEPALEPGATIRVQLVRGRTRLLFRAQFAGVRERDQLPVSLRRTEAALPDGGVACVLRPLQAAPTQAPQRRELFRLQVEVCDVPVTLALADGTRALGQVADVSGSGLRVVVPGECSAAPGTPGSVSGLGPMLGPELDRVRVRLVHATPEAEGRLALGLRLEDLSPADVDRVHARVLWMQRSRT